MFTNTGSCTESELCDEVFTTRDVFTKQEFSVISICHPVSSFLFVHFKTIFFKRKHCIMEAKHLAFWNKHSYISKIILIFKFCCIHT